MADDNIMPGPIFEPEKPIDTEDQRPKTVDPFVEKYRDRMHEGYGFWQFDYRNAKEDVDFIYKDDGQWPDFVQSQRSDRPMLTINLLVQYLNQMVGQARLNKYSIRVLQKSGTRNPVGMLGTGEMLSPSEAMEGLIRDVEQRSQAGMAYSRALQHAIEGGFGWLRVRTMDSPDDPMNMEAIIEHVQDRWSVMVDPYCERFDYADAEWCVISHKMINDEFEARFPNAKGSANMGTWSEDSMPFGQWYAGGEHVRVAEYYYKEPMMRTAVVYDHAEGGREFTVYEDQIEGIEDELEELGFTKREEREVDSYKMKVCLTTGYEVLEGPQDWPGMRIPVVPIFGRTVDYQDRREHHGAFHHAKDAARMHNYWLSVATEKMADTPHSPWIATPEQIAGHERQWANQHLERPNVLFYNHVPDQQPPQRIDNRAFPTGEINFAMQAKSSVQDTVGMHEADLGAKSNEKSGRAIAERRASGDRGTFEFADNLAHAIANIGLILCEILPSIYTGKTIRRILMPDETEAFVELNQTIEDEETGKKVRFGSLNMARFYTHSVASPHTATQRTLLLDVLTELGKTNPEGMLPMLDLIIEATDPPNKAELTRRAKMMVPREFLRPEDQQKLPQQQASPEAQAQQAEAEADMAKVEADKAKASADVEIAKLKLEEQKLKLAVAKEDAVASDPALEGGSGGESGGADEGKIAALVKREVAKAIAAMN